MSNFFNELKNRNVYKAATAYVVTGWLIMQVVDTMSNNLEWPPAIASWITKILIVGFPITLVVTWVHIGLFCSTPMVALSRNVAAKHAMEMLLTGDLVNG